MKKTFTQAILFAVCFIAATSCHKEVKKPVDKVPASNAKSTTTYTGTETTTQNQSSHSCPGSGGGDYTGNSHP